MKIKLLKTLLPLVAGLLSAAGANASTQTGLLAGYGFVDNLSVFEVGNANVQLNNGSALLNGNTAFYGNNVQVDLNNGSTITTLTFPSPFTSNVQLKMQNGSAIDNIQSSTGLATDYAAAQKASAGFAAMTANSTLPPMQGSDPNHPQINLNGGKLTLTAAAGATDVFSLQQIQLNNGSTLDLQGSSTSKYIFNISNNLQINNGSQIVLTGGVLASDVVFNFLGHGNVDVNNGSRLAGTLLALGGNVQMNNGSNAIVGAVISSGLNLNNGSVISAEY